MTIATIYHNPRCSKSRATLTLLEAQAVDIEIIEYLTTPPSVEHLLALCQQLNKKPVELIRHKEAVFKELGLSLTDTHSDEKWCQIMHDNPKLIERPIVICNEKAALGRPPENVLTLFS